MKPKGALAGLILAAYASPLLTEPKPEPRKPSGKDRSKAKAARAANRKRRQVEDTPR